MRAEGSRPLKHVRILLADDHKLVRAGFRAMLAGLQNVEVVAETGDGAEALQLIREHRPDIAFVDITMPSLTGLEVARRVSAEKKRCAHHHCFDAHD
jgi:DNA-binding NarL/FixJ family response regulator